MMMLWTMYVKSIFLKRIVLSPEAHRPFGATHLHHGLQSPELRSRESHGFEEEEGSVNDGPRE